jgi:hypothetical protein
MMTTGSLVFWLLAFMAAAWITLFGLYLLRLWKTRKAGAEWDPSGTAAGARDARRLDRDSQQDGRI